MSSSSDASESADGSSVTVEREWLAFGLALAILQFVFLVLVVGLLQVDVVLGLAVAATLSIAGGIGSMLFVLWWR
ncbi:hypothetical protein [Natronorubrum sp. FCH18a]|uniref:hypothetical protein n=1 Tax=Natronorubrum sp. FCH18a TaxID=3447018 RepID=UPI003F51300E